MLNMERKEFVEVEIFTYLGIKVDQQWWTEADKKADIKARIGKVRGAFLQSDCLTAT